MVRRWGSRILLMAWLVSAMAVGTAGAAEPAPALRGFTVSPAFSGVEVRADQPKATVQMRVSNNTTGDQNFRLSAVDFGALDEQGGVAFLGQPATELEHRYGLASWMTLEKQAVFVPAGGIVTVTVGIDNRPSLAPGGHYGAVLVTAVTETGEPVVDPKVGVRQVVASLILVTKEGGIEENLKLVSQTTNGGVWRLPTLVEHRFQNAGNVHLVPRGVVEIRDGLGRVVARGALNAGSGEILPESFRRYATPVAGIRPAWMPGYYKVVTTYRYDGTEQTKTLATGVWYAGAVIVWIVLPLALAAAAGLVWWLWGRPRKRRG